MTKFSFIVGPCKFVYVLFAPKGVIYPVPELFLLPVVPKCHRP
jgi:hypothetical protein